MAGQHVTEVNDSNFEKDVLQSAEPVLVDFWAAWCGRFVACIPVLKGSSSLARPLVGRSMSRQTAGPMQSMSPRQVKKACERPPHAQWARPAGHGFIQILTYLYGMFLSLLTTGTNIRGISQSLSIPVGPDPPGTGDRPLHSATARQLVAVHHPVSRPDRSSRLSVRRGASRHRARAPVVQRLFTPKAHRPTRSRHS